MTRSLCTALLVLAACGGNEGTKPVAPKAATAPTASQGQPAAATPGSAPPVAPLTLLLTVERSAQGIGLHVSNRGSAQVSLAADVALERKSGTGYSTVSAQALKLRFDCKSTGCVPLAPGSELLAPSWLGRPDGERCDALAELPAAGSYRFVVRDCSGQQQAEVSFSVVEP